MLSFIESKVFEVLDFVKRFPELCRYCRISKNWVDIRVGMKECKCNGMCNERIIYELFLVIENGFAQFRYRDWYSTVEYKTHSEFEINELEMLLVLVKLIYNEFRYYDCSCKCCLSDNES